MGQISSSDTECSESDTSASLSEHYHIPCISNTRLYEIDLERLRNEQYLIEIYNPSVMTEPESPKPRKPIRDTEELSYITNKSYRSHMKETSMQEKSSDLLESEESSDDDSIEYEKQTKRDQNEIDKNKQIRHLQNRSRTISPEKKSSEKKDVSKHYTPVQPLKATESKKHLIISFGIISLLFIFLAMLPSNKTQQQSTNHHHLIFESIKDVKAKFHNQESDSWNEIKSAINEVISRSPKAPSIILLFANETNTMDCLAAKLADVSSSILRTDDPQTFNPKDFGDNAGDVIHTLKTLKKNSPSAKVIVIHDILNINAEAIKALHVLCDRVCPLIDEAIYILTMQTNNYQPSKKRLTFVEETIRRKFSKNIDQDILMPLITRITDGAIIPVQPEPNLDCGN